MKQKIHIPCRPYTTCSLPRDSSIHLLSRCYLLPLSPIATMPSGHLSQQPEQYFQLFGTLWTAHVIFLDYLSHRKLPFISPFPQLFYPSVAVYHHLRHFAAHINLSNMFWTLITEITFKAKYKTVKVFLFVCFLVLFFFFLQECLNTFNIIFFKALLKAVSYSLVKWKLLWSTAIKWTHINSR